MLASEAIAMYGNKSRAAKALGVTPQSFGRKYQRELKRNERELKRSVGALNFPELPAKEEPIGDLLDRVEANYKRQRRHVDASQWQRIRVDEKLPIAVVHFGDCHLDDPGCNLPLLRKHVDLVRRTEGCYALNVGDYTNNWVGRLARLFANQDLGQSSARRLAEWLLVSDYGLNGHWLAVVLGNHDCVTPDHEVLTDRGWVPFPEVRATDTVLGYNVGSNTAEWQAINEVVSFDYEGPLHSFKTSRFSIKATPNHRFLAHRFSNFPNRYPLEYIEARELKSQFRVVNSGAVVTPGVPLTDDEITFAAWVLSDGHIGQRGYITLYQSKGIIYMTPLTKGRELSTLRG